MRLIDLSQPLYDAAPHCPVHPPVKFSIAADHPADGWRMEMISLSTHTGSHLDAPLHRLAGGKGITDLPLSSFVGPAHIIDLRKLGRDASIDDAVLRAHAPANCRGAILLLATGWGEKRAQSEEWELHSPAVVPSGARWLAGQGIRGVGIDHFSIGGMRPGDNEETHAILLGAGLWILEELFFSAEALACAQPVKLWALPLNWPGCSGAFCRPVLEVS